jgi:hypothetical protein
MEYTEHQLNSLLKNIDDKDEATQLTIYGEEGVAAQEYLKKKLGKNDTFWTIETLFLFIALVLLAGTEKNHNEIILNVVAIFVFIILMIPFHLITKRAEILNKLEKVQRYRNQ